MLELFILILAFKMPNGEIHVAHEGVNAATPMSMEQCEKLANRRKQSAAAQMDWVIPICVKLPDSKLEELQKKPQPKNPNAKMI